ncbi:hypothetical protein [uncultured Chryseobacterium sp.]|uniref:hypothetical protein n=1 Tax=uncultured Chryseobacterium sp. TaxID=259322 RepID=UPI00262BC602|nr:hypothetical protein [uncultured Chryseobacterium sp.]
MAKQDFSALIGKAKASQIKTPTQKVVSIKEKKEEVLFSLHIPKERMKQLKLLSAEQGKSLKELINSAIEKTYF